MDTNKESYPLSTAIGSAVALAATPEGGDTIQEADLATYIESLRGVDVHETDIRALLSREVPQDSSDFAHKWILGGTVTLIILPCDDNGLHLTTEELQSGKHIRLVLVNPHTHHSAIGEKYPAVLPSEIWQACTFNVTDHNPQTFIGHVLQAYRAWAQLTQRTG